MGVSDPFQIHNSNRKPSLMNAIHLVKSIISSSSEGKKKKSKKSQSQLSHVVPISVDKTIAEVKK